MTCLLTLPRSCAVLISLATGTAASGRLDCRLTEWTAWSPCTRSCDSGSMRRFRQIEELASNDGAGCMGSLLETRDCNSISCFPNGEPNLQAHPQDCRLSAWTLWSICSAGDADERLGQRTRNRAIEQAAEDGGRSCTGSLVHTSPCAMSNRQSQGAELSLDCMLGAWSAWSECSSTCGTGAKQRARKIIRLPQKDGIACNGPISEAIPCRSAVRCSRKQDRCMWSAWSRWSCSSDHHQAYRSRRERGGPGCWGVKSETMSCRKEACVLPEWGEWSMCSVTCGDGFRTRYRREAHLPSIARCPDPSGGRESGHCKLPACILEGCKVTAWSPWSPCSTTCSPGGQQTRSRHIAKGEVCSWNPNWDINFADSRRCEGLKECPSEHETENEVFCDRAGGAFTVGQPVVMRKSPRAKPGVVACVSRLNSDKIGVCGLPSGAITRASDFSACDVNHRMQLSHCRGSTFSFISCSQLDSVTEADDPDEEPVQIQRGEDTRDFLSNLLAHHPHTVENLTSMLDGTLSRIFGASKEDGKQAKEEEHSPTTTRMDETVRATTGIPDADELPAGGFKLDFPIGIMIGAVLAMVLCTGIALGALVHARLSRSRSQRDVDVRASLVRSGGQVDEENASGPAGSEPAVATADAE